MIHLYTFLAEPYVIRTTITITPKPTADPIYPAPPRVCEWRQKPSTRPICPACVEEQRRRERKL